MLSFLIFPNILGKKSPQAPQSFYPVEEAGENKKKIKKKWAVEMKDVCGAGLDHL